MWNHSFVEMIETNIELLPLILLFGKWKFILSSLMITQQRLIVSLVFGRECRVIHEEPCVAQGKKRTFAWMCFVSFLS